MRAIGVGCDAAPAQPNKGKRKGHQPTRTCSAHGARPYLRDFEKKNPNTWKAGPHISMHPRRQALSSSVIGSCHRFLHRDSRNYSLLTVDPRCVGRTISCLSCYLLDISVGEGVWLQHSRNPSRRHSATATAFDLDRKGNADYPFYLSG